MTVYKNNLAPKLIAALGISALSALPFATQQVLAGDSGVGHTHSHSPATKDKILDIAKGVRDKLIADGKVGATWKGIEPDGAEQKDFGKKREWVVTFKDPKAADKTKETLYLFFSLPGNYLAANYTGK